MHAHTCPQWRVEAQNPLTLGLMLSWFAALSKPTKRARSALITAYFAVALLRVVADVVLFHMVPSMVKRDRPSAPYLSGAAIACHLLLAALSITLVRGRFIILALLGMLVANVGALVCEVILLVSRMHFSVLLLVSYVLMYWTTFALTALLIYVNQGAPAPASGPGRQPPALRLRRPRHPSRPARPRAPLRAADSPAGGC